MHEEALLLPMEQSQDPLAYLFGISSTHVKDVQYSLFRTLMFDKQIY